MKHVTYAISLLMVASLCMIPSVLQAAIFDVVGLTPMTPDNKGDMSIGNANRLAIHDAIRNASTIDPMNPNVVQIPAGTYVVTGIAFTEKIDNVITQGVGNGLDGGLSTLLIKHCSGCPGNLPIVKDRDNGSTNLTWKDMAIDMDGIRDFGGMTFAGVNGLTIENMHIYDSNPQPYIANGVDDKDRYAMTLFVTNAIIQNNVIENLQVEFNKSEHVMVTNNLSIHPYTTAAFGGFVQSGSEGAFLRHMTFSNNTIINPESTFGINVSVDGKGIAFDMTIEDIAIVNNVIRYDADMPTHRDHVAKPIFLGQASFGTIAGTSTFDRTTIDGNRLYVHPALSDRVNLPGYITAQLRNDRSFTFTNLTITNNAIYANGLTRLVKFGHSNNHARNLNTDPATFIKHSNVLAPWRDPAEDPTVMPSLVNGDFETGDLTGWTVSTNPEVSLPHVELKKNHAYDGLYGLNFTGDQTGRNRVAEQTFNTVSGHVYYLVFHVGKNSKGGSRPAEAKVRAEVIGSTTLLAVEAGRPGGNDNSPEWNGFAYTFTADSPLTTLRFTDIRAWAPFNYELWLDRVSIVDLTH